MWNEIALAHMARRLPYSMAPTDPCVFSTLRVARLETTQLPVRNNCWAIRHFKWMQGPRKAEFNYLIGRRVMPLRMLSFLRRATSS